MDKNDSFKAEKVTAEQQRARTNQELIALGEEWADICGDRALKGDQFSLALANIITELADRLRILDSELVGANKRFAYSQNDAVSMEEAAIERAHKMQVTKADADN